MCYFLQNPMYFKMAINVNLQKNLPEKNGINRAIGPFGKNHV